MPLAGQLNQIKTWKTWNHFSVAAYFGGALEGRGRLSAPECLYVYLSVCDQATGHSFRPSSLIFRKYVLYDYGKKELFSFFEIFIFEFFPN